MTEQLYIESADSLLQRVERINEIINTLELRMLNYGVEGFDKEGYSLNDGQINISTQYRSVEDMTKGLTSLDALKQRYLNRLNGHSYALRSWPGLR